MTTVVPAIIPESFEHLRGKLMQVHRYVKRVQVDVMDGDVAPTISWPYDGPDTEIFEQFVHEEEGLPYWRDLDFEIDMMIRAPEKSALDWVQAGASAIIIHKGSTDNFEAVAKELHEADTEVGLAVLPSAELEEYKGLVEHADFVQIMGNDTIGYHGVELDEVVYDRVRALRAAFPELPIAVDIGVNEDTAPELAKAGVTKLVAGSAIFGADDVKKAIQSLGRAGD